MPDRDIINLPLSTEERVLLEEAARDSRLSLIQWIKITVLKAAAAQTGKHLP
jgi:hypothetical protein